MQIGQDAEWIGDPPLDSQSPLGVIWSVGKAKNKQLWPVQVQKQNIGPWPSPLLRLCGFVKSSPNYKQQQMDRPNYGVTISLPYILPPIPCSTNGRRILRLTATSSE